MAPVRRRHRSDGPARSGQARRTSRYVGLWRLDELRGIASTARDVDARRADDLRRHPASRRCCARSFRCCAHAARETGGDRDPESRHHRRQHRQRLAGCRYAAGAARLRRGARARSPSRGTRARAVRRPSTPATRQMDLAPDELIARRARCRAAAAGRDQDYRKVGTRRAQAISKVCFAGVARSTAASSRDVRLALRQRRADRRMRARPPRTPLRGQRARRDIVAAAEAALLHDIAPIDDVRSTASYRARVAVNLRQEISYGFDSSEGSTGSTRSRF